MSAAAVPNYLRPPDAPAREISRLEILQDRAQSLVNGLGQARARLNKVAETVLGLPPPTPASKDGGAVPVADAKLQRLSQQLDDAGYLLTGIFNEIERLETL